MPTSATGQGHGRPKRHRDHTQFVREPRELPVVLSPAEVARLLGAAPGLKCQAALSVTYGAGLRVSEFVHLFSSVKITAQPRWSE